MIERYNAIALRGRANFNSISSCSLASDKYTNRKLRLYGVADDAALNGILVLYEMGRNIKRKISIAIYFFEETGLNIEDRQIEKDWMDK